MKKILHIMILVAVVALTACNRDEANLFDQSAAERVQYAQEQVKTHLMAAENGWEMLYFPNPDAAGYALLCKFNNDGSVLFAAKNKVSSSNLYKEEASLWTTDGTQGCILSFSSYNTLFTVFADPGSDGVGYEGDYEFVVLSSNADQLQLKGKKHGAYVKMNKLATDQDWKKYFDKIDAFNNDIFTGNDGIVLTYVAGDTMSYEMTYNQGAFTYQDTTGADFQKGFIITPTGLHFYSGCPLSGSEELAKDFILNEDKSAIVNTENPLVYFTGSYSPAQFFAYKFEKYARWIYTEEGTDAATVAAVNEIKTLAAANGAEITRLAYDHYKRLNDKTGRYVHNYSIYVAYQVENKLFEGRLTCSFSNANDQLTYTYTSAEAVLSPLLKRINANEAAAAKLFTDIFCDTFTATSYTGTKLNMVQLGLQSTTNADKYIHVIADITK